MDDEVGHASPPLGEPVLDRGLLRTIATVTVAVPVLGWVAWWNGFPLVYPDSAAYLRAFPVVYRSPFYGWFLRAAAGHGATAHAVGIQAAIVAYIVSVTVRALGVRQWGTQAFLTATLALVSTLPWFVALLMPDVFAGTIPLLIFVLTRPAGRVSRVELLPVAVLATAAVSFHASHMPLYAILAILATLAVVRRGSNPSGPIMLVAMPLLLAAIAGLCANMTLFGRVAILPAKDSFLLARLLADGSAKRYLAAACPREPFALCPYLDDLPNDSDKLLWETGAFRSLGYLDSRQSEAGRIVAATVRTYPGEVAVASLQNIWHLLARSDLDDVTGSKRWFGQLDRIIARRRRSELAAYEVSRQSSGVLGRDIPRRTIPYVSVLCLAIVLLRLVRLRGWRDELSTLISLGLAGIVVNAAVMASVSGVQSRYQTRMLWVLPLLAGCCIVEWASHAAHRWKENGQSEANVVSDRASQLVLPPPQPPAA